MFSITSSFKWSIIVLLIFYLPLHAEEKIEKLIIISSGPAGLSAALYSARAQLSPLIIEGEELGGQLSFTDRIENYPGVAAPTSTNTLIHSMHQQAEQHGARFITAKVVETSLDQQPFSLTLEDGQLLKCHALIIATGASAKWLGLPSERALRGYGVSSCAICDGFFFRNREVVVIGGGDSALEEALLLTRYAKKITIIHRRDQLKASKLLQERVNAQEKIAFIWDSVVEEIKDVESKQVTGVLLRNVKTGEKLFHPCDGVFVAIGHRPNSSIFKEQLTLDQEEYIVVHLPSTATSIPGVFAAGDVADPYYKQAITAAGSGAKAAIDADHYLTSLLSPSEKGFSSSP